MKPSKRIFDLICALILFLLSLPFWIIIAVIIKIDSKGPVLFKQFRVGRRGKLFTIYKFRTMYQEAPAYFTKPLSSMEHRITRIGRMIRDLGVDELPQLINVIKGDMSLVGPRPEMLFIVANYDALAKRRLELTPGITGLWQIAAPKNDPIHHHLKYDLYYLKYQSFRLDFWILMKTLGILLGSRILFRSENRLPLFLKERLEFWSNS